MLDHELYTLQPNWQGLGHGQCWPNITLTIFNALILTDRISQCMQYLFARMYRYGRPLLWCLVLSLDKPCVRCSGFMLSAVGIDALDQA